MTHTSDRLTGRTLARFVRASCLPMMVAAGTAATHATAQTPAAAVSASSPTGDVKIVAPGDGVIDGTRVTTGRIAFAVNGALNGQTLDFGTMTQEASRIDVGGKPALRVIQTTTSSMGTSTDTAIAMLQTLAPVSLRGHNPGGAMTLEFSSAAVTGQRRDTSGNTEPIKQTLTQPAFDANIIDVLIAGLPLQLNYAAKLPLYIFEQGGLVWCSIHVAGEATKDGVAAWDVVVDMPDAATHYMISKADRTNLGAQFNATNGFRITMTRKSK